MNSTELRNVLMAGLFWVLGSLFPTAKASLLSLLRPPLSYSFRVVVGNESSSLGGQVLFHQGLSSIMHGGPIQVPRIFISFEGEDLFIDVPEERFRSKVDLFSFLLQWIFKSKILGAKAWALESAPGISEARFIVCSSPLYLLRWDLIVISSASLWARHRKKPTRRGWFFSSFSAKGKHTTLQSAFRLDWPSFYKETRGALSDVLLLLT